MASFWEWMKILFLIICCVAALWFISPHASAADTTAEDLLSLNTTNISYAVVTGFTDMLGLPPAVPENVPYIQQGDVVYVGDYIDVSGVVPPYPALAYWDGFDMYDAVPKYNYTMPDGKKSYYHFYLDPAIFNTRLGKWYKYNGEYEPQGNNLAFVVKPKRLSNSTMTYPNGTSVNLSKAIEANYTPISIKPDPLLPERHVADYVVAKGDEIAWPVGGYHLWVFGRVNGVYDWPENTISKKQVEGLENGRYTIVVQTAGNNTLYESRYENNTLIPGLYGRKPIDATGMSPMVVFSKMKELLAGTDDQIYEYTLDVDNPSITINRADEMYFNGKTVLDVRGYTNVANGTPITVTLDERNTYYKNIPERTATGTAIRTGNGNLSYFRAYVPIDYDELAADATNHTLTARTDIGGSVQKDFKISIMPADSYRPNATLKYIEGRNPFVPTPTPEVRTVVVTQTIRVVERITIPVTPTNEQVKAQQDAVITDKIVLALFVIVGAGVLAAMLWYMYSVYRRGRKIQ
jgi:hypothetical protein